MELNFKAGQNNYTINSKEPIDISIPLIFNGRQPNTYDVEEASAKAYETNGFIGDTRKGGSCNFEQYTLVPHCNGTHTECVGHISYERISINKILNDSFIPSTIITVTPEKAFDTQDTYTPNKNEDDLLVTKSSLEIALKNSDRNFLDGLIIRTMPNNDSKKLRKYMQQAPCFFSIAAIEFINEIGVNHLLVDFPSLDKMFDEGKLTAHHIYWNVERESHDVDIKNHSLKTVTEMIYIADEIKDGNYIANIQIPNFVADAAPSRVLLYEIIGKDL